MYWNKNKCVDNDEQTGESLAHFKRDKHENMQNI